MKDLAKDRTRAMLMDYRVFNTKEWVDIHNRLIEAKRPDLASIAARRSAQRAAADGGAYLELAQELAFHADRLAQTLPEHLRRDPQKVLRFTAPIFGGIASMLFGDAPGATAFGVVAGWIIGDMLGRLWRGGKQDV